MSWLNPVLLWILLAVLTTGCQTLRPNSKETDPLGRWIDAE